MKPNKGIRRTAGILTVAGLLSLPAAAMAFSGPAPGPQHCPPPMGRPMMAHGWAGHRHRPDSRTIAQRIDARMARLKADLHLKPDQMAAWQRFDGTVQGETQAMLKRFKHFHPRWNKATGDQQKTWRQRSMSAPQRMDRRVKALQARLQILQKLDSATKAFYAHLSPTQQTIFNLEAPRHRHWHHAFHHWR